MMSADFQDSGAATASGRSLMPPYVVLRDFLDEATVSGLIDYALARQADFAPTRLGSKAVDAAIRVSASLRDLGDYRQTLETRLLTIVPELIAKLKVSPLHDAKLELELVAHGDGAFYKPHIDTQTARYDDVRLIRALSGVYYFNAEPKAFAGGALRLYAIGDAPAENFVDIEPLRNSLLVFPSWAPHEVMPVICPSRRFIDSRFAINCWLLRKKPDATPNTRRDTGSR